jgi:hypothetical protein
MNGVYMGLGSQPALLSVHYERCCNARAGQTDTLTLHPEKTCPAVSKPLTLLPATNSRAWLAGFSDSSMKHVKH